MSCREDIQEQARSVLADAGFGSWCIDIPAGDIHWCEHNARLYGLPNDRRAMPVEGWLNMMHPADRPRVHAAHRSSITEGIPLDVEYRLIRPDGDVRWFHSKGTLLPNAAGPWTHIAGVTQDLTERKWIRTQSHSMDGLLDVVLRHLPVGIIIAKAPSGRMIIVNQEVERIFRHLVHYADSIGNYGAYKGFDKDGGALSPQAWPLARSITSGEIVLGEEVGFERGDGTRGVLNIHSTPVTNLEGSIIAAVMVMEDVTEHKATQEGQRLLIAELDHRVRNAFSSILALVQLAAKSYQNKDQYVEALDGRIRALVRAHGALAEGTWQGASLQQLIGIELAPYLGADRSRLSIAGPDLALTPKAAEAISLMVHELATNAGKYGSLSVPQGRITVTVRVDGEIENGHLQLTWTEADGPPVTPPAQAGFGTHLIREVFRRALDADVQLRFSPLGVEFSVKMALATVKADGSVCCRPAALPDLSRWSGEYRSTSNARVLVVEDDAFIGLYIRTVLEKSGIQVTGPIARLKEGLAVAGEADLDAAILDMNLWDEPVTPLADILAQRGIPFAFLTAYGDRMVLPARFYQRPILQKPPSDSALVEVVRQLLCVDEVSATE